MFLSVMLFRNVVRSSSRVVFAYKTDVSCFVLLFSAQHLWCSAWEHLKAFVRDLVDLKMLPIKLLFFMELAGKRSDGS